MNVYEIVTERLLADMQAGVLPWARPWRTDGTAAGGAFMPVNAATGRSYRGVNCWLLAPPKGATVNRWLTYKQAADKGGHVRKGEKGQIAVFWKPHALTVAGGPKDDGTEKAARSIPLLRYFTVFHVSQCDGLDEDIAVGPVVEPMPEAARHAAADKLMALASVQHGGDRAFYAPSVDRIVLPQMTAFKAPADYYATALHELTHWTGHSSRLAREYGKRFGDSAYAREELVAEMGAAFLCASVGLPYQTQHASYLKSWCDVMRADSRAIVQASGAAQKAADYVLNGAADAGAGDDEASEGDTVAA